VLVALAWWCASKVSLLRFGALIVGGMRGVQERLVFCFARNVTPLSFGGDLVAPTRPSERRSLVDGRLNSRPGPSGWKLFFLRLFPEWAQGAYWQLVNTQRSCALVAHQAKLADQVHIPKTSGGIRPPSMLEESPKAIEGVSSRRRVLARKDLRVRQIYASSNLAGEPGFQAAAEAMYVDCFVCEDSLRHFMPLSRVGADYEKIFLRGNMLQGNQNSAMLHAKREV
jgi:hypothetical protein